ncbi:glycosyltransferase family 2 protein [Bacteroides fragilis]|uniref:Glycosyltransferase family 2 protein n=1 Tax=Bacteroides fragilis TaxID=817 RepID=A0ABD4VTV3_BACFG|nr:glycosyltransferase family 2 protein [Bacteroides fragilis]MCE8540439.1 glycosyltransferase family 2 protein [Bacteroides fragilis]MCE8641880.1 glycosyltransferase family 2 protein [Bacteroides fragilis]MCM0325839.1 glycosyltransferase family 2 protein [Bacteroides fragilis]MCZ2654694.1 glycosyltransferase family 2 protein [Bacteroides fragilis]WMI95735.1 hypothetical protein BFGS084_03174 [Bacteroides fragilis]
MENNGYNNMLDLTVVVPTYNRRVELVRLLKSFLKTDYLLINEFIISDNHSSYDVYETLKEELPTVFFEKCRIVVNNCNIGGQGNINNCFLLAKTRWMWMIGDDDIVTESSIDIILRDISSDPECAWFKYSTSNIDALEEDCSMNTLHGFIDYYFKEKRHAGNLVFMSNNIYNLHKLAPYIHYAFDYSYTFVSQIIPPLMGLDDRQIYVKYRSESICRYSIPANEEQWNCVKVFLGTATIENIPFVSLNLLEIRKLKNIFIFWPMNSFVLWIEKNEHKIRRTDLLKKVYNTFYCPTRLRDRIIFALIYFQIKYKIRIFTFFKNVWKYNKH